MFKRNQDHEFSCVLLDLPTELARRVREIAGSIRAGDLVEAADKPHVTLLYGLHTEDAKQVESALAREGPIRVRLGKTGFFPPNEHNDGNDVVYVEVFSPDLHRLHAKLRRTLPHTVNFPRYQPHLTVAYVKPGSGTRYVGRGDLSQEVFEVDEVWFCNKSGRRSRIAVSGVKRADFGWDVPALLAAGAVLGPLLGRYGVAPLLSRFGFDPERSRSTATWGGLAAGLLPGVLLGLSRYRLTGNPFDRLRPPRTRDEHLRFLQSALGYSPERIQPVYPVVKRGAVNPYTYDPRLWNPTFPVSQALDDVQRNPLIPPAQRVRMRELIAEAGQAQGSGMTGMASPGALMAALPDVVSYAVPTVGGAWAAAELLGAPRTLKNTALGAALLYSALKGLIEGRR